jgi:hypothetical protein
VLKDDYVSESTSLHIFAKRMLDLLQYADHMDAGETRYAQVRLKKGNFNMIVAIVTATQLLHCS